MCRDVVCHVGLTAAECCVTDPRARLCLSVIIHSVLTSSPSPSTLTTSTMTTTTTAAAAADDDDDDDDE